MVCQGSCMDCDVPEEPISLRTLSEDELRERLNNAYRYLKALVVQAGGELMIERLTLAHLHEEERELIDIRETKAGLMLRLG